MTILQTARVECERKKEKKKDIVILGLRLNMCRPESDAMIQTSPLPFAYCATFFRSSLHILSLDMSDTISSPKRHPEDDRAYRKPVPPSNWPSIKLIYLPEGPHFCVFSLFKFLIHCIPQEDIRKVPMSVV